MTYNNTRKNKFPDEVKKERKKENQQKRRAITMYNFTRDCYIGIPEIDQEHIKLFQLINEAIASMKHSSTNKAALANYLLDELKDYTLTHFSHEEAYMEKICDPELPRQRREHTEFISKINSYPLKNCTEENAEDIMQEMMSFLVRWLYRHILSSDILIGKMTNKINKEELLSEIFHFSSKYYTGINFIDEEHKKLFSIVKEAYQLIEAQFLHDKYDKIMVILKDLKEYTEFHFQNEEIYMEKINYPGLEIQKQAHDAFSSRLEEITYTDIGSMEDQEKYLHELLEFLMIWLTNHILKLDCQIPLE